MSLGGYLEPVPPWPLARACVFLALLLVTALLEWLQTRLKETEPDHWWASNGRDVLNIVALVVSGVGLYVLGFSGPLLLIVASGLTLVLSLFQSSIVKRRRPLWIAFAGTFSLGLPWVLAPRALSEGLLKLVGLLF